MEVPPYHEEAYDSPCMPSHHSLDDWHEFPGCESWDACPTPTEARGVLDAVLPLLLPGTLERIPLGDGRDRARQDAFDVLRVRLRAALRGLTSTHPMLEDAVVLSIPRLRAMLAGDLEAAERGDPAMTSPSEAWLCYPGIRAIAVYRFAHELHLGQARVLARMLSEMAHSETGIDIHPGAKIGARCFIDHGTGVVIGETAKIGDGCRLYQQVTLGARSLPTDADGRVLRGSEQRHPTLEDDVVVYAGATILGGDTVVGRGCVVGGGVFLTESVPPHHVVTAAPAEIRVRSRL